VNDDTDESLLDGSMFAFNSFSEEFIIKPQDGSAAGEYHLKIVATVTNDPK